MDLSRRKKEFLRIHHLEAETQDNHTLKSLTFCLYEGETVGFLEKDDSGMDALLCPFSAGVRSRYPGNFIWRAEKFPDGRKQRPESRESIGFTRKAA